MRFGARIFRWVPRRSENVGDLLARAQGEHALMFGRLRLGARIAGSAAIAIGGGAAFVVRHLALDPTQTLPCVIAVVQPCV